MTIHEMIMALRQIDEEAIKNGVSSHFLEVVTTGPDANEITVRGNREGLIHLGLTCLAIAEKATEGSHQTFDENTLLDRADMNLTICFKTPDWQKKHTEPSAGPYGSPAAGSPSGQP